MQAIGLNHSALLVDKTGNVFKKESPNKTFNVQVYHPTTKLESGRPNWLINNNKLYISVNEEIYIEFHYLLLVYNDEDSDTAVPIDNIELQNKVTQRS
jgi:hypothetical protein